MFLFNKSLETTGALQYEVSGAAITASGLKTYSSPYNITGSARFLISDRIEKVIPSKQGRTKIDVLTTQFGWDEIRQLAITGIYMKPGNLKLKYGEETFRLTNVDNFGQDYDREFRPLGLIELKFERQKTDDVD